MKQVKKGEGIKKKSLSDFKKSIGLTIDENHLANSNADKPLEWLTMPRAFQEATRLPGFPQGYISMIGGFSDTGKTTILNHVLVAAQRQGLIPVIYDTENNMDWRYLMDMGFEAEPIMGDVDTEIVNAETGEITIEKQRKVIGYDGNFIYFNSTILAERYGNYDYDTGKTTKDKRKVAVIDDIAASIKELLDAQDRGDLEQGLVFCWDSIGSVGSYKSYKSLTGNNMFDAATVSRAFSGILNNRIPVSRKISSKYTNTMVAISKIWLDSMSNPGSAPTVKYKTGETFYYACHGLIVHVGGALTKGIKHLKAISGGCNYKYGVESKIKVVKNQLPSPYTVVFEGPLICTPHGLISKDELPSYQKANIATFIKELNKMVKDGNIIREEDVEFIEEEDGLTEE
ncbi:MAG: hypothetical protein LUD72_08420 [Bacteroidales bacterium]|nr:hypothetical protein [Bacteroidales bacterium]